MFKKPGDLDNPDNPTQTIRVELGWVGLKKFSGWIELKFLRTEILVRFAGLITFWWFNPNRTETIKLNIYIYTTFIIIIFIYTTNKFFSHKILYNFYVILL